MSAAKHTPGPWEVCGGHFVCSASGVLTASADSAESNAGLDVLEGFANARLIAAAPELLDACRALLRDMLAVDAGGSFGLELQVGIDQAYKAIAKATGVAL